jgi:hypothetical protein
VRRHNVGVQLEGDYRLELALWTRVVHVLVGPSLHVLVGHVQVELVLSGRLKAAVHAVVLVARMRRRHVAVEILKYHSC